MPTEPTPVLELRQVSAGYERGPVLETVSMPVFATDYLAVLGPNGGGKTTLLKVLLGLLPPWRGEVVNRLPHGARRLGWVPQFNTFERGYPMRVLDVALMGRLGLRGLGRRYRDEDRRAALESLETVGLADRRHEAVDGLSGGQIQRLLLARALAGEPEAMFLDEPMASLDPESREVVRRLLRELSQRMPVVLVTHDATAVARDVRHIACINRRLTYHGGPELTQETLEETYGCPVDLIAHGVPHRVLATHAPDGESAGPAKGHDHG